MPVGRRASGRCLVVHDDLELRLRLAALVRRAFPKLDADCINAASFDALTPANGSRGYVALLLIVEFSLRDDAADPLARLARTRGQAPNLPIFVFARGGDERNAARTIKLGANDYWPIHAVNVGELTEVIAAAGRSRRRPAAAAAAAAAPADPWRQQPKIAGYSDDEDHCAVDHGGGLSGAQRRIGAAGGAQGADAQGPSRRVRGRPPALHPRMPDSVLAESPLDRRCAGLRHHGRLLCFWRWNTFPAAACATG